MLVYSGQLSCSLIRFLRVGNLIRNDCPQGESGGSHYIIRVKMWQFLGVMDVQRTLNST